MQQLNGKTPIQIIEDPLLKKYNVSIYMKREDLIDHEISGNKWRKMKYNLEEAQRQGHDCLLTFGGAFSNHIAAVAAAGRRYGLKTIGVIRGEENLPLNDTLQLAKENGMQLEYMSRDAYRMKEDSTVQETLRSQFGRFYLLPEGGSNALAVKGCMEILTNETKGFDVICCPVGSGGTLAGIVAASEGQQDVIGFSALKGGDFLHDHIRKLLKEYAKLSGNRFDSIPRFEINTSYHFGGFAKINDQLVEFIRSFYEQTGIPLDLIYTAKMVYGIYDLLCKGKLQGKKILLIHTGGLQGNSGLIKRYGLQKMF